MGKVSRRVQSGEADQRRKQHAQRRQSTRSDVTLTFKRLLQLDCLDDLLNDRALARGLQASVRDVGIVSRRGRFDGSQHVGQHVAGPSQQVALQTTVTTTPTMNNSRRRHERRHHKCKKMQKCNNKKRHCQNGHEYSHKPLRHHSLRRDSAATRQILDTPRQRREPPKRPKPHQGRQHRTIVCSSDTTTVDALRLFVITVDTADLSIFAASVPVLAPRLVASADMAVDARPGADDDDDGAAAVDGLKCATVDKHRTSSTTPRASTIKRDSRRDIATASSSTTASPTAVSSGDTPWEECSSEPAVAAAPSGGPSSLSSAWNDAASWCVSRSAWVWDATA